MKITPRITLLGAGPGDPDLLTVKGVKVLQSANVVLYDALANTCLLDYAPAHALKIFVGKRAGKDGIAQSEIHKQMVHYACTYGHVVRLKGGDPFVFGRGHEELAYAREQGIQASVVPGISSAIASPELQGIPLTGRGLSESFWVLTGTTQSEQLSEDLSLAIQSTATIVILMGMNKLSEISKLYTLYGKPHIPAMVTVNSSLPNEAFVIGCIHEIAEKAQALIAQGPGTIVIGEVVRQHPAWALLQSCESWKYAC